MSACEIYTNSKKIALANMIDFTIYILNVIVVSDLLQKSMRK